MSVSDPIADFLTGVRNAIRAKRRKVDVPATRFKTEIARVLLRERYINNFKVIEDRKQGVLRSTSSTPPTSRAWSAGSSA
jgi:small subunit ribosomal protein S8